MERRDYLMTQIQQLGRFFSLLADRLRGKTTPLNLEDEYSSLKEDFREKCGFDMDVLATPNFELLKDALMARNSFNSQNIELLADFISLLVRKSVQEPPTMILRLKSNAIQLYELLEVTDKTYSMERQSKIEELKLYI